MTWFLYYETGQFSGYQLIPVATFDTKENAEIALNEIKKHQEEYVETGMYGQNCNKCGSTQYCEGEYIHGESTRLRHYWQGGVEKAKCFSRNFSIIQMPNNPQDLFDTIVSADSYFIGPGP